MRAFAAQRWYVVAAAAVLVAFSAGAAAQTAVAPMRRALASNIILPQQRAFSSVRRGGTVSIEQVNVGVVILEQVATTTMDISLRNPTGSRLEAELIVPVPDGAVVRGFTFQGSGAEPSAVLLPKNEARSTYDAIVAKIRDPALLEFLGYNLIRSSVFPVEAGGTQKVRLTYEHLLPADGDRVDYVLPRSESLDYKVPWNVSVKIKSKRPVSTVYSPSHELETVRREPGVVSTRITAAARTEPGAFRLSYLLDAVDGVSASLFAYPDASEGGGYFLLLAGLPAELPRTGAEPAIKREVTLVLDRSGSMRGEKLEQVREAALQIIAGLAPGEAFNIIVYNEAVDLFAPRAVAKDDAAVKRATAYLQNVRASGGTNIHDALLEALRTEPAEGALPIVLFLTDGLPTMGETSEVAIRKLATDANPHNRRIFTFGVGVDVNTPLLDKIASVTRARATFVLPREDVEVKVASVFKRLAGPVLADPVLVGLNPTTSARPRSDIKHVLPAVLPDMFEGDQLVVLGRYTMEGPIEFILSGNYLGGQRKFKFDFNFNEIATTRNAFVPRLWASRKIGTLLEAIRALGADTDVPGATAATSDPRIKELVDEIVRLSTEFGILTEYTAFLAREGTDLSRFDDVRAEAQRNFYFRNSSRNGLASMNQEWNGKFMRYQQVANSTNFIYNTNLERVAVTGVQQVSDRAFFRRDGRWIDSRLTGKGDAAQPTTVVEFGSEDFRKLALRLADQGRQGTIALRGEILMEVDGETILVHNGDGR